MMPMKMPNPAAPAMGDDTMAPPFKAKPKVPDMSGGIAKPRFDRMMRGRGGRTGADASSSSSSSGSKKGDKC